MHHRLSRTGLLLPRNRGTDPGPRRASSVQIGPIRTISRRADPTVRLSIPIDQRPRPLRANPPRTVSDPGAPHFGGLVSAVGSSRSPSMVCPSSIDRVVPVSKPIDPGSSPVGDGERANDPRERRHTWRDPTAPVVPAGQRKDAKPDSLSEGGWDRDPCRVSRGGLNPIAPFHRRETYRSRPGTLRGQIQASHWSILALQHQGAISGGNGGWEEGFEATSSRIRLRSEGDPISTTFSCRTIEFGERHQGILLVRSDPLGSRS